MRNMRRLPHILYSWAIIGFGFWLLAYTFPLLDLDHGREFLLLAGLVIMSEWLAVSFLQVQLSGGFAVIFATFLIFGPVATAWVNGLATLIGQGVVNRGDPARTVLFNSAQCVVASLGANFFYVLAGGLPGRSLVLVNFLPLAVFVITYFILNQFLVYIYTLPSRREYPLFRWVDAMRWDGLTYFVTVPVALLMALLHAKIGIYGTVLLFIPVMTVQFMLSFYVRLELKNRELRALYEVARRLGGNLKLEEILDLVLRETKRVISYHTGIVYIWSHQDGCYRVGAVVGPHARLLEDSIVRRGEGFLGLVAESGESQIVNDTRRDVRTVNDVGLTQVHRSMVVVPLVAETEVLGLIVLGDKRPGFFEDKHLQTLTIIGGQAAVAIANVQLYRKLELTSITDCLTGLYNYRYFYKRFLEEFQRAARYGSKLSLLMLDVDFFKKVNDRYGHLAGDALLAGVAGVIAGEVRSCDLVARYGGEEFAVLMPETGPVEAMHVAERIRRAVRENTIEFDGARIKVSISAGVASYPAHADNPRDLLSAADFALYRAKEEGRDSSVLFSTQGK